jgi:hypothetical protein
MLVLLLVIWICGWKNGICFSPSDIYHVTVNMSTLVFIDPEERTILWSLGVEKFELIVSHSFRTLPLLWQLCRPVIHMKSAH